MKINVVMLVRDRFNLTRQALNSLASNTTCEYSLTVVDDESYTDWRVLRDHLVLTHNGNYHLLRRDKSSGTGAARNCGVAVAREFYGKDNLLYLSDNDVFFKPGWDRVLLAAHEQFKGFKIIGGGCHPFMQPHDIPYLGITGTEHRMTSRDAVSGYSWLLDWETWDSFGPLDENGLGVRQSEDWAMCQRVRKAGFYVGSVWPEVVLHTGLTDTFGERPPGWELMEASKEEGVIYE